MPEERLQKFLSRAGIASRRQAEVLILSGRVKINNRTVKELGVKVDPKRDRVDVNSQKVETPSELVYFALNKPKGAVSSRQDKFGRPTVYDLLPALWRKKVWSIGRVREA